jgi:hypothetical protein
MSGPRFDQTVRGAHFYDRQLPALLEQVPKLVRELTRLNENLERVADRLASQPARPNDEPTE